MTAMTIHFNGVDYTLTNEASLSSYGEPVLVAPGGAQYRGREIVAMLPAYDDGICAAPERPLFARDVANGGEHEAARGQAFRDDGGMLTAYGHETAELFRRYMCQ